MIAGPVVERMEILLLSDLDLFPLKYIRQFTRDAKVSVQISKRSLKQEFRDFYCIKKTIKSIY